MHKEAKRVFYTTDSFNKKLSEIHGKTIRVYSEFTRQKDYCNAVCQECGHKWNPQFEKLLLGRGCPECAIKKRSDGRMLTTNEFLEKLKNVHGEAYSMIGDYKGSIVKTKFKCKSCENIWEATPNKLLCGRGCPKCGIKRRAKKRSLPHDIFVQRILKIHSNKISILNKLENTESRAICKCNVCSYIWETRANKLLYEATGCPDCARVLYQSTGNRIVEDVLRKHNFNFQMEVMFDECRYRRKLRFDAGIFDDRGKCVALIEFDGQLHFKAYDLYGGEDGFQMTKKRDSIKNKFCKDNEIPLLRIPYWEKAKIEDIILDFTNELQSLTIRVII